MAKGNAMAELLAEYGDKFEMLEEMANEEKKREEELARQLAEEQKIKENTPKDKTLKCKKCEKEWVWTVAEQEFYKQKGFYKPSLCKECRKKRKTVNNFHKVDEDK